MTSSIVIGLSNSAISMTELAASYELAVQNNNWSEVGRILPKIIEVTRQATELIDSTDPNLGTETREAITEMLAHMEAEYGTKEIEAPSSTGGQVLDQPSVRPKVTAKKKELKDVK